MYKGQNNLQFGMVGVVYIYIAEHFLEGSTIYRGCFVAWLNPGLVPWSHVGLVWLPILVLGPGLGC
jgi:hypothetical protein